jgi:hypothetical protein
MHGTLKSFMYFIYKFLTPLFAAPKKLYIWKSLEL